MSQRHSRHETGNPFLTPPIGRLFLSNARPMAIVKSMGGILNMVDGIFVGRLLGAHALAAVSLAFPFAMLLSALSTLVGDGMSSLIAWHLGAGERGLAGRTFGSADGLALLISFGLAIAVLDLGIAGTALGTLLAQVLGLALLIAVRLRRQDLLSLPVLRLKDLLGNSARSSVWGCRSASVSWASLLSRKRCSLTCRSTPTPTLTLSLPHTG